MKIALETHRGERLGLVSVSQSGELLVEASGAALRARIAKELRQLINQGPILERSGHEETLPDGTRRFVSAARVCQPGEPGYLRSLAELIGLSGIMIEGKRVYARVETEADPR